MKNTIQKQQILKKISLFLIGIIIFLGIVNSLYSAETSKIFRKYTGKNNGTLCSGSPCTKNDTWTFQIKDILIFDSDRSSYSEGIRGLLQGELKSKLFGDFSPSSSDNGDKGLKLTDQGEQVYCGEQQRTYEVSGTIKSPLFGTLKVDATKSRFCPANTKSEIFFIATDVMKKKFITASGSIDEKVGNVFEKQQVAILGKGIIKGSLEGLLSETGDTQINALKSTGFINRSVHTLIDKKIAEISRNIANPQKTDTSLGDFLHPNLQINQEKIFYYDYSGKEKSSDTYGNKGHIVSITKSNFSESEAKKYIIKIKGKNTIIVKGANIYINADLSNENDKNSLLTIISQRDDNNNGGNIYIDPDVTNIDAVLIADGSLLSYRKRLPDFPDGKILNRNDSTLPAGLLGRQLYIYGALISKNVIGTKKVPYGSDADIFQSKENFGNKKKNIYDLANLRAFQMRYAPESGDCSGNKDFWVPGYTSTSKLTQVKTYAWAGKRKCFNSQIHSSADPLKSQPIDGLRTTKRSNSVVLEYNPYIQQNPSYILKQ